MVEGIPISDPSVGRYLLGIATLLITLGSLAFAAVKIRRHFLPDWTGALARLAETVVTAALLTAILEVLGTVGLFSLAPITVASVLTGWGTTRALGGTPDVRASRSPGARLAPYPAPRVQSGLRHCHSGHSTRSS